MEHIWDTVLAYLVWFEEGFIAHERTITGLFAIILTVSTILLWWSTRNLWKATDRTAKHIPRAERAYIYGGFGGRGVSNSDDLEARIQAQVTMANYGRTPGFIKYIEVGTGHIDDLPDEPVYSRRFDILDLYFPLMRMEDVRRTRAWVEIPSDGRHVVFQRVWYTDIFDKLHFSSSIYRLFFSWQNGLHFFDEPIRPGSAYWAWDKEEEE
jgi:hypothetical protein